MVVSYEVICIGPIATRSQARSGWVDEHGRRIYDRGSEATCWGGEMDDSSCCELGQPESLEKDDLE